MKQSSSKSAKKMVFFKFSHGEAKLFYSNTLNTSQLKEVKQFFDLLMKNFKIVLPASGSRKWPAIHFYIHLCSGAKIRSLNKKYRHKDKVTDVLSFPLHEDLRNQVKQTKSKKLLLPSPLFLGEIFIALPVAKKQAQEFAIPLSQEIFQLFVHGLMHLWGYDHEINAAEARIMFSLEEKIVKKVFKQYCQQKV